MQRGFKCHKTDRSAQKVQCIQKFMAGQRQV